MLFRSDDLDPPPLISLIPLTPVRPKRKGDPTSKRWQPPPVAKTGYCGFTTRDRDLPRDGDAHLEFLLDMVEQRIDAIRQIMLAQSLDWHAVFFKGDAEGQSFTDLSPGLVDRATRLGLSLRASEY